MKNIKRKIFLLCFLIISWLIMIMGCTQELSIQNDSDNATSENQTGNILLSIINTKNDVRTIFPATFITPTKYDISGDGPGLESFSISNITSDQTNDYLITNLAIGDWTITVKGKNDSGVVLVSGEDVVTVTKDSTANKTISVNYLQNGKGGVDITISWSGADIDKVEMQIDYDPTSDLIPVGNSVTYVNTDISADFYTFKFKLKYNNVVFAAVIESVYIFNGHTTTATITLDADDFNKPPTAPTALTATEGTGGIILSWADTSSIETGFVVERSASSDFAVIDLSDDLQANTMTSPTYLCSENSTYYYRVKATNSFGSSSYSNSVNILWKKPEFSAFITPVDNSTDVNVRSNIEIKMNERMDSTVKGTVSFATPSITFTDSVNCVITYKKTDVTNDTIVINPKGIFQGLKEYQNITIAGFKDYGGNEMVSTNQSSYSFTTYSAIGYNYPEDGENFGVIDQSGWSTATWELGANMSGSDLEIALFSKNATRVLLEIYSAKTGENALYDYWMVKNTTEGKNIWRAKIKSAPAGTLYAFRCWGPNWTYSKLWNRGNDTTADGFVSDVDANGNRYNPNKVLFDPYARELSHDKETPEMTAAGENGGMYGTSGTDIDAGHTYTGPCTNNIAIDRRKVDTGKWATKSVFVNDTTSFGTKPNRPQKDAIVYEAHVRGLTNHSSSASLQTILNGFSGFESVVDVPTEYKGTYKGAGYMAKYLKALGINTIEFLPVHETANDINPDDNPGGNYWGYMTFGYFAPDRRYSSDKTPGGTTKEFKEMVAAFHAEGIEVYLDVVYNHTGEGGTWDTTKQTVGLTSFNGIDNAEYYALVDGAKDTYWESTGCGNNLYTDNAPVRQFVLDSLTYWIDEMGVDGFRFDLAPVIGRGGPPNYTFSSSNWVITAIRDLGASKDAEMIAEAWDTQWPGGYQVSNFPVETSSGAKDGWGEWNGFYRDSVRKFIKGGGNKTSGYPSFCDVFHGSYGPLDRSSGNTHTGFNDQGGPHKSVNFIVAHDGFTLMDLVSYNSKQNDTLTWPFGPSDGGSSDNDSWDSGGDQSLRRQQLRNLWTIQMFSRGVPMIVWGDEFARTQNGNNNPYNIDSVATWNNYNMINTDSPNTVSTDGGGSYHNNFGTDASADGKNNLFLFAKYVIGLRNTYSSLRQEDYSIGISYKKNDGISSLQDSDRCVWIRIDGSSNDFLLFINSYSSDVDFTIPSTSGSWKRIIDTAAWAESTNNNYWESGFYETNGGVNYNVKAWSVTVFREDSAFGNTVATPEFNLNTGVYTGTKSLTISCVTTGATIKYTTDGSDPLTSGTAVSGLSPQTVSLTPNGGNGKGGYFIRAIATKVTYNDSLIEERRYAITDPYNITTTFGSNVMLQGFHWDSCKTRETISTNWYVIMNNFAEEIRDNFQWVWFPPSTAAADGPREGYREGYMPTQLNLLDGDYGTETELITAISSIYNGGTSGHSAKAVADIVINHRCGSTTWSDFTNPTMGIDTINNYYRAITWGDNAFSDLASPQYDLSSDKRGWSDTGSDFGSARDLDHTNTTVQSDILVWMDYLKNTVGFKGWRYDFVKGFDGKYVGYYNSKTSPEISIGELWEDPISQTGLDNWVTATNSGGCKSMVFDFATKDKLNSAFGWYKYSTYPTISETSYTYPKLDVLKSSYSTPAGYIGWHSENSVTFVDNHDTGSTQGHWKLKDDKVYLAYVYTLTHPGLPCVAWEHYFDWVLNTDYSDTFGTYVPTGTNLTTLKQHIDALISIRKDNGITNTSSVVFDMAITTEYGVKIDDKVAVRIGTTSTYTPSGTGWSIVYSGTDFCIWTKTPEITVKKPVDTEISNGNTYNFGTILSTTTKDVTFDIYNDGGVDLTFDQIVIDGTNDTKFSIISPPSYPVTVTAGNSTTFTIRFTPGTDGTYSAYVTIPNNDNNEGTFVINLSGTGGAPLSNDATLSDLTVDIKTKNVTNGTLGAFDSAFDSSDISYAISATNIKEIDVTPTLNDLNATITSVKLNGGSAITPVGGVYTIALAKASSGSNTTADTANTVTVLVTAEDGLTTKTYTIDVDRVEQLDFYFKLPYWSGTLGGTNISISGNGTQTLNNSVTNNGWGAWTNSVTLGVQDSSALVYFTTEFSQDSNVKYLGIESAYGSWPSFTTSTGSVYISAAGTMHWFSAPDDEYYWLDSARFTNFLPNADATLIGLTIVEKTKNVTNGTFGTLTPEFDSGTISYSVSVTNIKEVDVTPTVNVNGGVITSVKLNGGSTITPVGGVYTVALATASAGSNTTASTANDIAVLVTAEDGTIKTYTIDVNRVEQIVLHYKRPAYSNGGPNIDHNSNGGNVTQSYMGVADGEGWHNYTAPVNDSSTALNFRLTHWESSVRWDVYKDTSWGWFSVTSTSGDIWLQNETWFHDTDATQKEAYISGGNVTYTKP